MVQVLRWYLSSFSASRKSTIAKKPYNPIIGEMFRCWWPMPSLASPTPTQSAPPVPGPVPWCGDTDLVFLAEQVSHHPPISGFYVECPARQISFTGHIYTKSAFLGMSVAVHNIGEGRVSLLSTGEDYVVTFPSAYGRSILTTPWAELEKFESRRLWREVTQGLKFNNIEQATNAKCGLEQKQREEAKERKEKGEKWDNRLFLPIGENWHFKEPLGNRI